MALKGAKSLSQTPNFDLLPTSWIPDAPMERVICHWTAGNYHASDHDLISYHFLIDGACKLHKGTFSVTDNVDNLIWEPRNYAAHARATNSNSIGISVCCMKDAIEEPFDGGDAPMLECQWDTMTNIIGQLCLRYGIRVAPETVLGHGEVHDTLGNPQDGKWDPLCLPWQPNLTKQDVGRKLRRDVLAAMMRQSIHLRTG